jgi:hypothetical protein
VNKNNQVRDGSERGSRMAAAGTVNSGIGVLH